MDLFADIFCKTEIQVYPIEEEFWFLLKVEINFLGDRHMSSCLPNYSGPCYGDIACCTENCFNHVCMPPNE